MGSRWRGSPPVRKEIHVLSNSNETGLAGKAELADWLLSGQAAAELFLRPATLANWRTLGKGPALHKCGRTVIYLREDLELWKRSQRHECDEPNRPPAIPVYVPRPGRVSGNRLGGHRTQSETRGRAGSGPQAPSAGGSAGDSK